jgi:hypothetical protein
MGKVVGMSIMIKMIKTKRFRFKINKLRHFRF